MSVPKYPEYKDSGVEWLGKVPAHWEVKPLKRAIASVESGTSVNAADFPAAQGELGVLKTSCVYKRWFDWRENKTVNQEDLGRVSCPVLKNTLIVSRMNTPELVGSAGLVVEAPAGIFLPDRLWQVSLQESCSPKYYYYYTRTLAYRDQVKIACAGTSFSMQNLGQDEFGAIWHPSPPKQEQHVIAAFLDHETARLDALVEQQKRLIGLLKEKRQAVISHAVTKGLDPDVPMKDTGVEWLGEVPAHWEVAPLKYLAREKVAGPYGASLTKAMYTTSGYRVYGQQQVIPNDFSLGDYYISKEKFEEMSRYQVFPGDVLFSVMGTIGKVAVVPAGVEPGIINPRLVRYRFCHRVDPDFLRLLVMSRHYQENLQESAQGSTMEGLNMSILGNLPIMLPGPEEQREIVARLTQESFLLEDLVSQAKHAMGLLTERRSALISAAVTGKIDVRGWQVDQQTEQSEMLMAAEERATYG